MNAQPELSSQTDSNKVKKKVQSKVQDLFVGIEWKVIAHSDGWNPFTKYVEETHFYLMLILEEGI